MPVYAQSSCPAWEWALKPAGVRTEYANAITSDGQGNVYITGAFENNISFGNTAFTSYGHRDIFVTKLDSAGQYIWTVRAGGGGWDEAHGISVDDSGNIYVTGRISGSPVFGSTTLNTSGARDAFIARISSSGQWLWAKKIGSPGDNMGMAVKAEPSGKNIYLAGEFENSITLGSTTLSSVGITDVFITKMDSSGQYRWAVRAGGSSYDRSRGVDLGPSGSIYVVGRYVDSATFGSTNLTSAGSIDPFISRLDTSGQWIWTVSPGGNYQDFAYACASDSSGNLYVTGTISSTVAFGNTTLHGNTLSNTFYIAKIDSTGQWQWARQSIGTATGRSVSVGVHGDVYATGEFSDSTSFGTTGFLRYKEMFVTKLDDAGQWKWAIRGDASFFTEGKAVTAGIKGNIYVAGDSRGIVTLGDSVMQSQGFDDIYYGRLKDITIQALAGNDTTINCGNSLVLKGSGYGTSPLQYRWSPAVALDDSTLARPVATPNQTTIFTLEVYDTLGCAVATDDVTVTVANPVPAITTGTGANFICDNGLTLTAGPGFQTYTWSTGDTTQNIQVNAPGTYTVFVEDSAGCNGTNAINIAPLGNISIRNAHSTELCGPADTVILDAGNGFDSYAWNTGDTTQTLQVTAPGKYYATLQQGSCSYTDTLTITLRPSQLTAAFSVGLSGYQAHFTEQTMGVVSRLWDFGDGSTSTAKDPVHTYTANGTYLVCYTAMDSCGTTDSVCNPIKINPQFSIDESTENNDRMYLYPNPVSGRFISLKITGTSPPPTDVYLLDFTGRLLSKQNLEWVNSVTRVELPALAHGEYVLKVVFSDGVIHKKVWIDNP